MFKRSYFCQNTMKTNTASEIELKTNINILALMTLRHMLRATRDYMFNFLEEEESEATPVLASKD